MQISFAAMPLGSHGHFRAATLHHNTRPVFSGRQYYQYNTKKGTLADYYNDELKIDGYQPTYIKIHSKYYLIKGVELEKGKSTYTVTTEDESLLFAESDSSRDRTFRFQESTQVTFALKQEKQNIINRWFGSKN